MNKHPIHQTPAEKLATSSLGTLEAIQKNTLKMDEVVRAIHSISLTPDVKSAQKLEEVKSAILANTIILKRLEKKEMTVNVDVDTAETHRLLRELIAESKKPMKVSFKLV